VSRKRLSLHILGVDTKVESKGLISQGRHKDEVPAGKDKLGWPSKLTQSSFFDCRSSSDSTSGRFNISKALQAIKDTKGRDPLEGAGVTK